jgi:2-dehydro-3-deoxygluconokinase
MRPGDRPSVFVGFGDLMLRLATPGNQRIVQAGQFEARYTGAEANVAVSLTAYGIPTRIASRVPEGELGQACINQLRQYGLDTRFIARGGDRLGLFYLETGAAQRASTVIYDRTGSSFVTATPDDYDWEAILEGAGWLHFSGTAPALGPTVQEVLLRGLEVARSAGVTVSCDLNYRSRLWAREEARSAMSRIVPFVDVLIGNEEDASAMLDVHASGSDLTTGELPIDSYLEVAGQLIDRYGLRLVATSLRTSLSASSNRWAGLLTDGTVHAVSQTYTIEPIVDRVGGGDSFAAGVIFGQMTGAGLQETAEFAVAASCLKHSIPGDFNLVSLAEVEALAGGDASGRVRR